MSFIDHIDSDSSYVPSSDSIIPLIQDPLLNMPDNIFTVLIDGTGPVSQNEQGQITTHDNISSVDEEGEDEGSMYPSNQKSNSSVSTFEWKTKPQQIIRERMSVSDGGEYPTTLLSPPPVVSNKVTFLPEEKVWFDRYRHHYSKRTPRMTIREMAERVYNKLYISSTTNRKILNLRQQIQWRFKAEGKDCRTHKHIATYYYNWNRRRDGFERSNDADEYIMY